MCVFSDHFNGSGSYMECRNALDTRREGFRDMSFRNYSHQFRTFKWHTFTRLPGNGSTDYGYVGNFICIGYRLSLHIYAPKDSHFNV